MKLGTLNLQIVSDGHFRLDGGAMFGVVPRVLWERKKRPDAVNRIEMATNCLLIESGREVLLVDTGIGDKHDSRFIEMFGLEQGGRRLPESIRAAGYDLEDVTHVLMTHLHFDHCGWNTRERAGRLVPTFPRARYWIQRGEAEHAKNPNDRDRASYDARNWQALYEADVVEHFDDDAEPAAGVRMQRVPGHNADMCIVLLDGGEGSRGVYWADLVPTTAHLPYPWVMGYDLYPLTTMENKQQWLPRAAAGEWLCFFEHDADQAMARIEEQKPGRFVVVPIDE
jgi:glyoxylase-like metal-dependent hydrolase (beta-lactamase superfamily II)